MDELAQLHCTQVTATTPRMNERDISYYLAQVEDWRIVVKDSVSQLEKVFTFKDSKQATIFINLVGQAANEENHHPEILTAPGNVTVTWWTHRIKGLYLNDFIMAARTDVLYDEAV